MRDLSALFDPRSVAVVGASNDEAKYGNWLTVQALRMCGVRDVHLVNRRGVAVLGRPTVRTLADVGAAVDLVVVTVPADGFEAAVDDALAAGARAIVGVTSGFAEAGPAGRGVQERVVARTREAGALLLGPNCLGLYDGTTALTLTSNAMPPGRIALLSQSGNVALELKNTLVAHGHGFSRFVSIGNQADVDVADLVNDCARHEGTDVIAVYCEDFRAGRKFVDAASAAGKPIVLLTVGGSQASVRGARSHTGSMTSSSAVVDAACEAAGIHRVRSPRAMVNVATTLARYGLARGNRVGVIADGGGHASLAADLAVAAGLRVPEFSAALRDQVGTLLPTAGTVGNPVDIASGPDLDITTFVTVSETMLGSAELDGLLITGFLGGYGEYGPTMAGVELDVVERIGALAASQDKPVLVHSLYPEGAAAHALRTAGVPVFATIDEATECLGLIAGRVAPRPLRHVEPAEPFRTAAGYGEARELLRATGLGFPESRLVRRAADVLEAGRAIGFPVVLKALGLLHKSDVGGVAVGLADEDALRAAAAQMEAVLAPPGYSVEAMADGRGLELVIGTQRDPHFGCVVAVGMGGVHAEVFADVTHALAPVDEQTALAMLMRLRCAPILTGHRGQPPLAMHRAVRVVAAISVLAAAHPEIRELEANPVLLTPDSITGLDARSVQEQRWTSD